MAHFQQSGYELYQLEQDRLETAENVAQVFWACGFSVASAIISVRPWTWTTTTALPRSSRKWPKAGCRPRETIVFTRVGGEVNHLVGGA